MCGHLGRCCCTGVYFSRSSAPAKTSRSCWACASFPRRAYCSSLTRSPCGWVGEDATDRCACREALADSRAAAAAEGRSPEAPSARSKDSADLLAEDEDALRAAAWRWRFNRRWAQEQARQMDPDYGRQVSMHPYAFLRSQTVHSRTRCDHSWGFHLCLADIVLASCCRKA